MQLSNHKNNWPIYEIIAAKIQLSEHNTKEKWIFL